MVQNEIQEQLAAKAVRKTENGNRLTKGMTIVDMIKTMEPEIRKALPTVMTPERFTRIAVSALNTTPRLVECSKMSFIAALMNAAQLGLEVNTPTGQAYLIPYNNKGQMECQFQIGYKGLLDLAYRNPEIQIIQAQTVYENDDFEYELGLDSKLYHKPAMTDRGAIRCFYALYKLKNGGYGFEVMSKADVDAFARRYSKSVERAASPWNTNFEAMAKKTCIKQLLKYAPLRSDLAKAVSMDESIKNEISVDMSDVQNSEIYDAEVVDQEPCEMPFR